MYEIGRIFRNEGMDPKHNPEFTSVELYQAYADFNDMMDLFEDLLSSAAQKILGTYEVTWQGEAINLAPWLAEDDHGRGGKEVPGVDFMAIDRGRRGRGPPPSPSAWTWTGWRPPGATHCTRAFDQRVEEKLIQPTFITMHPVDVSPLAKRSPKDPRLTERFELFICHSEMGNAFSELNDPIDQRERFQKQVEVRAGGDERQSLMDGENSKKP